MHATILGLAAVTVVFLLTSMLSGFGLISSIRSMAQFSGLVHHASALLLVAAVVAAHGAVGTYLIWTGRRLSRAEGLPERMGAIAVRNLSRWLSPFVLAAVFLVLAWWSGRWATVDDGGGAIEVPMWHVFVGSSSVGFQFVALFAAGLAVVSQTRLLRQVRARGEGSRSGPSVPSPPVSVASAEPSGEGPAR
jgi:hypothetical protein